MQEQNNVYQIPKGDHREDYLNKSPDVVAKSIDDEVGVIFDLHLASERAVPLEQVKALQEVDAIISRSEQESSPKINKNAPEYLNDQEKEHYLNVKEIGLKLTNARYEMLSSALVVDNEQEEKLKRK